MKKFLLSIFAASTLLLAGVVHAEDITGRWLTASKDAYVEIRAEGNTYTGRIVGVPEGADKNRPSTDVNNSDESLRDRKLIGLDILTNLKKAKSNLWKGGTIYDPTKGESYNCKVWLEDGVLMLRGYKGMFYRTSEWTKAPAVNL